MGLLECGLQLLQLFFGEYGPVPSLPLGRRAREHGRGTVVMAAGGPMVARNRHGHHVTGINALVTSRGHCKRTNVNVNVVVVVVACRRLLCAEPGTRCFHTPDLTQSFQR